MHAHTAVRGQPGAAECVALATQEAKAYVGERPPALILVANKSDCDRYVVPRVMSAGVIRRRKGEWPHRAHCCSTERVVSETEGREFAMKHGIPLFVEASAKTGRGVEQAFFDVLQLVCTRTHAQGARAQHPQTRACAHTRTHAQSHTHMPIWKLPCEHKRAKRERALAATGPSGNGPKRKRA